MKPRDIYWYRRRTVVRVLFWITVAITFYAVMDALTPESCESAATFTDICI